jgi:hypothetical protein
VRLNSPAAISPAKTVSVPALIAFNRENAWYSEAE